jgi:hypothetical protein
MKEEQKGITTEMTEYYSVPAYIEQSPFSFSVELFSAAIL